jgi:hypothetical protein
MGIFMGSAHDSRVRLDGVPQPDHVCAADYNVARLASQQLVRHNFLKLQMNFRR